MRQTLLRLFALLGGGSYRFNLCVRAGNYIIYQRNSFR